MLTLLTSAFLLQKCAESQHVVVVGVGVGVGNTIRGFHFGKLNGKTHAIVRARSSMWTTKSQQFDDLFL